MDNITTMVKLPETIITALAQNTYCDGYIRDEYDVIIKFREYDGDADIDDVIEDIVNDSISLDDSEIWSSAYKIMDYIGSAIRGRKLIINPNDITELIRDGQREYLHDMIDYNKRELYHNYVLEQLSNRGFYVPLAAIEKNGYDAGDIRESLHDFFKTRIQMIMDEKMDIYRDYETFAELKMVANIIEYELQQKINRDLIESGVM